MRLPRIIFILGFIGIASLNVGGPVLYYYVAKGQAPWQLSSAPCSMTWEHTTRPQ